MNNDNMISVLFSLENNSNQIHHSDEIESLYFIVDDDNNGLEYNVSYIEQLDDSEVELEVLLKGWEIHSVFNILSNAVSVILGMNDGIEVKIDSSNLSIKEVVELGEDEEVHYNPKTLEVL